MHNMPRHRPGKTYQTIETAIHIVSHQDIGLEVSNQRSRCDEHGEQIVKTEGKISRPKEVRQYSRGGQSALLDRVRKLLVLDTLEERVRQDFVNRLIDQQKFPATIIDTEYPLGRTPVGKKEGSKERADVIVWERPNRKALLLAEIKSPNISLDDDKTLDQVMRYQKLLHARYLVITNGTETRSYMVKRSCPVQISNDLKHSDLKSYCHQGDEGDEGIRRLSYSDITNKAYLSKLKDKSAVIGVDTPEDLHPIISELDNFLLCHEFRSHFPVEHYGISILEDLGYSDRKYGNASGGSWPGLYRGFLVRDLQGDHQTYWMSIMPTRKTRDDPKYGNRKGRTTLLVAVDDFDLKKHNALQMCLDTSLCRNRNSYRLTHVGRKSGIPNAEVLCKVRSLAPHLLTGDSSQIDLGKVVSGRSLSWESFGPTLLNILLYAAIRESMKK